MTDVDGHLITREKSPDSPLWRLCPSCNADEGEGCSDWNGRTFPQGIFCALRITPPQETDNAPR